MARINIDQSRRTNFSKFVRVVVFSGSLNTSGECLYFISYVLVVTLLKVAL